ncbi:hypothetical protein GCM10023107_40900 [Actinoplanes octamycinicus]|nr:hypothetical protein Aoc01nite_85870 [Actinoplanes octamycinicus]
MPFEGCGPAPSVARRKFRADFGTAAISSEPRPVWEAWILPETTRLSECHPGAEPGPGHHQRVDVRECLIGDRRNASGHRTRSRFQPLCESPVPLADRIMASEQGSHIRNNQHDATDSLSVPDSVHSGGYVAQLTDRSLRTNRE